MESPRKRDARFDGVVFWVAIGILGYTIDVPFLEWIAGLFLAMWLVGESGLLGGHGGFPQQDQQNSK